MKCRNYFTKEGTREEKSGNKLLLSKINDIICLTPIVKVAEPSDVSNLMVEGTRLKDLKSSTDIGGTRLLVVGISRGIPLLRPALLVEVSS